MLAAGIGAVVLPALAMASDSCRRLGRTEGRAGSDRTVAVGNSSGQRENTH